MTNLAIIENRQLEKQSKEFELMSLIKETYAKGATDEEVKFFAQVCTTQSLDPIKRQIYFTKIWDSSQGKSVFTPIVSIDGMRSKAEETGQYAGQTLPLFCGEDGVWKEIWTSKNPPFAAKVGVYRKDFKDPIYAIAQFDAYAKKTKDGKITKFWLEMGYHMLAKCAEALALRKALPQKLSGLYSEDERHKDTIDVDFKKDDDDKKENQNQNQKRQLQQDPFIQNKTKDSENEFSFTNQFNSKIDEFMIDIDKLCSENLGKQIIDKDFEISFRSEFLQYFKDEYIKNNGNVKINELFNKKLTAKRLTLLALKNNAIRDEKLDDKQLHGLKKVVYDRFVQEKDADLTAIFIEEANNFIPF